MVKLNTTLLDEIGAINWFSQVGSKVSDIQNCVQVKNWDECETYFFSPDWEDTTLEARNDLTAFLSKKNVREYSEWNNLTIEGQDFLKSSVIPKIEKLDIPVQNLEVLKACIRWDLLGCLMESAYEKYRVPQFFTHLLELYKQGHFPCGWQGKWPDGKLVVF